MSKRKNKKLDTSIEWFDRYCPICGKFIEKGSPSHECLDKDLKDIYEEEKEEDEEEKDPSFGDKLSDGDFLSKIMELDDDIEKDC